MSLVNEEAMDVGSVASTSTEIGNESKTKNVSVSVSGFYGKTRGKVILEELSCSDGDNDDFTIISLGDSVVIEQGSDDIVIDDEGKVMPRPTLGDSDGVVIEHSSDDKGEGKVRPRPILRKKRKTSLYYARPSGDSDTSYYSDDSDDEFTPPFAASTPIHVKKRGKGASASVVVPGDSAATTSVVVPVGCDSDPTTSVVPGDSAATTSVVVPVGCDSAPTTSVVAGDSAATTSVVVAEDVEHPLLTAKGRTRVEHKEKWACNVAKKLKNLGQSYQSATKKTGAKVTVPPKKVGPPCNCKNLCFATVGQDGVLLIAKSYWSLGDYNMQTSYLQKCIQKKPIKRKRTKAVESKKKWTLAYNVTLRDKEITICKAAFLSIHSITSQRIETAINKKLSVGGTTIMDMRGTNPNVKKLTGPILECAHEHIQQLPVCSSHYTRQHTPNRQYLEADLSIRSLHEKYLEWMEFIHPDVELVKLKYYNKIFSRHYNIGFRPVKQDSCNTCEKFTKAIVDGKRAGTDVSQLQEEQQEHHEKRNVASSAMKAAKAVDKDWVCIAMDLQQTMPCPRLSVSSAYYKRKLWLYNFCVHNIQENESYMYVWEEHVAARGSLEIASCLVKWIGDHVLNKPDHPKNLRIFADNCGGQNKNIVMTITLLREIHLLHFDRIELCYLVSGHSYMACDRSFGVIERSIRKCESIMSPKRYCHKIENARQIKKFPVCHMTREHFMDFGSFLTTKKAHRRSVTGRQFLNAAQIIIHSGYRQGYILKKDYNVPDSEGTKVSVAPPKASVSSFDLSRLPLPLKYTQDRQLQTSKVTDLECLMQYMGNLESEWLRDIIAKQRELYSDGEAVDDLLVEPDEPESDQVYDYDLAVRYYGRSTTP